MTTPRNAASLPRLALPPLARLIGAALLFAATALLALWLATSQPWMGLVLEGGDDGLVVLREVERNDLSETVAAGMRVAAVGGLPLRAQDLIEEPDTLASYAAVNAFRARQAELAAVLQQPRVTLAVSLKDGSGGEIELAPYAGRPAWSLPFEFWLQLMVGGAGMVLGGWVWALKRDLASRFLAVTGFGLMLSAVSASVYSTRELALPAVDLTALMAGNYLGTNIFGLALVSLLLVYPHRLAGRRLIAAVWAGGGALVAAHLLQLMPSQALGSYGPMLAQFVAIFGLLLIQLIRSRRAPLARAALGWFGLSILLGTGVFVFAIAVPVLLGLEPQASQAHAFGIILVIYCGLAVAVARYRLFDLGIWSFRLVSYLLGGFILIALDAVLIYVVAIERVPAFGLALLAVAVLYLPVRNLLGQLLTQRSRLDPSRTREVFDIALCRDPAEKMRRWRDLLDTCFAPLQIDEVDVATRVELLDGGQHLLVPGTVATPALVLRYAQGGRRLFSQADADRLQELVDLMRHALASRDAQERGARQERSRMARDLHDNIGAQLLRTLHSHDPGRKDAIVAETLTDLRDIINNAQGSGMKLDEILAELRFETNERLSDAGLAMAWQADVDAGALIDARLAHTLRSIIREAASNTIRYGQASRFELNLHQTEDGLTLEIVDDGIGFPETARRRDGGLVNMATRVQGHGGAFSATGLGGTRLSAHLPFAADAP